MTRFYYLIFVLFLVTIGAILPSLYPILIHSLSSDVYPTLNLVSSHSFLIGHLYTAAASVLLLLVAWMFKPRYPAKSSLQFYLGKFMSYEGIIFGTALLSLSISIILDGLYGMSASNLLPQRPMIAVYLAYIARVFWCSVPLFIVAQIYFLGKLNRKGLLISFLLLADMALSWSRSGLLVVFFMILTGLAYSPVIFKIKRRIIVLTILLGLSSAVAGDLSRGGGDLAEPAASALLRFYVNNQALFLAVEDQGKIRDILLYNEPAVMFSQMFSFFIERTEYPSSFRLLEYWGATMTETEGGHITGYAYGWLGLTYGIFGWSGLWFLTAILAFYFFMLRVLFSKPSFSNLAFSVYFSGMLFEYFINFGLDSFAEKAFKGFLSVLVYILLVVLLKLLTRTHRTEP